MHTFHVSVKNLFLLTVILLVTGCAGIDTFHQYARAGDTVAVAVGWQEGFSRDRVSVYFLPPNGDPGDWVEYPPNDPSIRAIVNFYPDPLSSIALSQRTAQDITPFAQIYATTLTSGYTGGQRDWWNTVVFFDLPDPLPLGATGTPTGTARISVQDQLGNSIISNVEILPGSGASHMFDAAGVGPMNRNQMSAMERASHYTVNLSGTNIPHAVEMTFTHDTGVGKAYVVEPISGYKSISWTDDGTTLKVIILPSNGKTFASFNDFRFYVAGGITNLTPVSTQGFKIDGTDEPGVSPTIVARNIVISAN